MHQLTLVNKPFCLHQLFESNYHKLLRLIPQLHSIQSSAMISEPSDKPTLSLKVIEKTKYTLEIHLCYHCHADIHETIGTDAPLKIRVYLDTQLAEIIAASTHLTTVPAKDYPKAALEAKWLDNYHFEKWLTYCLSQGYQMIETPQIQAIPA